MTGSCKRPVSYAAPQDEVHLYRRQAVVTTTAAPVATVTAAPPAATTTPPTVAAPPATTAPPAAATTTAAPVTATTPSVVKGSATTVPAAPAVTSATSIGQTSAAAATTNANGQIILGQTGGNVPQSSGGISTPAIIGLAIGGLAAILLIAIVLLVRRSRHRTAPLPSRLSQVRLTSGSRLASPNRFTSETGKDMMRNRAQKALSPIGAAGGHMIAPQMVAAPAEYYGQTEPRYPSYYGASPVYGTEEVYSGYNTTSPYPYGTGNGPYVQQDAHHLESQPADISHVQRTQI